MNTKLKTLFNPNEAELDVHFEDGEDIVYVIYTMKENGNVRIETDMQTTCKRVETSLNRYFRAIPENHPVRKYWNDEMADMDYIKESVKQSGEFSIYDENETYNVGVELHSGGNENWYYVWLNYEVTGEEFAHDYPELYEEVKRTSYYNESEEVEAEEVKSTPTQEQIVSIIEATKTRSQWDKGVKQYAIELVEQFFPEEFKEKNWDTPQQIKSNLLNNASNWKEYSYGGIPLAYDREIAQRLATPTELKLTKGGLKDPNKYENWLDVQARALYQACNLVVQSIEKVGK